MPKASRLKHLLSQLGVSAGALEKELNIKRGVIATAIRRDSKLSLETVNKIQKRYPNINIEWLETGKGDIFQSEKKQSGLVEEHDEEYQIKEPMSLATIQALRRSDMHRIFTEKMATHTLADLFTEMALEIENMKQKIEVLEEKM